MVILPYRKQYVWDILNVVVQAHALEVCVFEKFKFIRGKNDVIGNCVFSKWHHLIKCYVHIYDKCIYLHIFIVNGFVVNNTPNPTQQQISSEDWYKELNIYLSSK